MIIIWALFGLVAIARAKHPAPFRTRSLSAEALMVLRLKAWESKSLPNLINPKISLCNGLLRSLYWVQASTLEPKKCELDNCNRKVLMMK